MPSVVALTLDDATLSRLAELVAERIKDHRAGVEHWLDVAGAAAHLAVPRSRVYELSHKSEANGFPVHKDGTRIYFLASELDAWRLRAG